MRNSSSTLTNQFPVQLVSQTAPLAILCSSQEPRFIFLGRRDWMLYPIACTFVCVQQGCVSQWLLGAVLLGLCYTTLQFRYWMKIRQGRRGSHGPFGNPPAPKTGCIASARFIDTSFGPLTARGAIRSFIRAKFKCTQAVTYRHEQYPHTICADCCNRHAVSRSRLHMPL